MRWIVVISVTHIVVGCTGIISDPVGGAEEVRDSGSTDELRCEAEILAPGPTSMRRLTQREYRTTVADLFGPDTLALTASIPPESEAHNGFRNQAVQLGMDASRAASYRTSAEGVAALVEADPDRYAEALGVECDPASAACLRAFVEELGRLAYRRPLERTEVDALVELADSMGRPDAPWSRVAVVVEALLQSPDFLFKVEVGRPVRDRTDVVALTGYEIATRLTYLLWGTTPDSALLDRAEAGELDDAAGVRAVAREMLSDPRAADALMDLPRDWFRLDELSQLSFDPVALPAFDEDLRQAMLLEAELLLRDHLIGDRSFLDVYTAPYGYADEALAALYGVDAPSGDASARVELDPALHQRGGIFSTAAMLALTSTPTSTSPIRRGVYVRRIALCQEIEPPDGVPALEEMEGESAVDALDRHASDPSCRGCHDMIDPIGWGLDRYGPIGGLRDVAEGGGPVRLEGRIEGLDPPEFAGAVELGQRIAASEPASRCVPLQLFRWGLGRDEEAVDDCTLQRLDDAFESSGHSFEELLIGFVGSDAFRYGQAATMQAATMAEE